MHQHTLHWTRRRFIQRVGAVGLAGSVRLQQPTGADRFRLGVITDEVSQDLEEGLQFAQQYDLHWVELRNLWNTYVTDLSRSAMERAKDLLDRYPELQVLGTVADFTRQLDVLPKERSLLLCFLGSTIGNMSEDEGIAFLRQVANNMKPGDALLVGFDMVKPKATLEAAYNDSKGITARFNKNVLRVVNNELNATFDPSHFDHLAFFNKADSRIEMHLRANRDVAVTIESIGMESQFRPGETIHTENSRKFTRTSIAAMIGRAGLSVRHWYSDEAGWFSLVLMELMSS